MVYSSLIDIRAINDQLMKFEQNFLLNEGLPLRDSAAERFVIVNTLINIKRLSSYYELIL